MRIVFKTKRLRVIKANKNDIPFIMSLERHPENRNAVVQGTEEQHSNEVQDKNYLLLIIKLKSVPIGFMLCHKDRQNSSFELRRMIIQSKGMGYGKEAILALIDYAMNKLNYNRFWLDVYEDNKKAIHLYESLGMHLDGVLEKSYKRDNEFINTHIYSLEKK